MKHYLMGILTLVVVTSVFAETHCLSKGKYLTLEGEEKPHTEIRVKDGFVTHYQMWNEIDIVKGPTPVTKIDGGFSFKLDNTLDFMGGPFYTAKLLEDRIEFSNSWGKIEMWLECLND